MIASSCSQLVAGNYDVIVNEPATFRSALEDFLQRFQEHETKLANGGGADCSYTNEFKLLKEFSKTLKEDKANLEEGEQEFNLRKNRYKDILPFTHTRVLLQSDPLLPGSGYINANYIRGPSGSPRAYIAAQGPLPCTLLDFWRMIWECGVSVVVMACNEYESGKPKCEIYWPDQINASQCYGNIQVTLVKERQICSDFLIRKFSVKLLQVDHTHTSHSQPPPPPSSTGAASDNNNTIHNNTPDGSYQNHHFQKKQPPYQETADGGGEEFEASTGVDDRREDTERPVRVLLERTICQFHYTTWPDHGAPDSVQPILELVRLMRDVQPTEDRPILVHCSAGCGRTGTICCIDYVCGLLRRGKLESSFDLCNIISDMRQQRMAMVQTLEQYILCHRAVAALFINQLKLIDNHTYENLDLSTDGDDDDDDDEEDEDDDEDEEKASLEEQDEEQDLGPVFI